MGQDLIYRAVGSEIERRITTADWKLIEELRRHLPDEAEALFIVPDMGEEVEVSVETLQEAAEQMEAFFSKKSDILPYTYKFRCERMPGQEITPGYGSGGLSGIRLPGDSEHYYFLRAGLDECSLERYGVGPDGRGFPIDIRDLRQESELVTETVGTITFRRSRAKTNLRETLGVIRRFMETVDAATVVKRID